MSNKQVRARGARKPAIAAEPVLPKPVAETSTAISAALAAEAVAAEPEVVLAVLPVVEPEPAPAATAEPVEPVETFAPPVAEALASPTAAVASAVPPTEELNNMATQPETMNGTTTMNGMNGAAKTAFEQGKAAFEQAQTRTREAMDRSVKSIEEMNDLARGNVEAMVQAGRAATQGFEALAHTATEFTKRQVEETTAAVKTLAAAKTPNEFFQAQTDFFKSQVDALVAETSRTTETMLKLMGEVMEPLQNRMALAVDRVAKAGTVAR